MGLNGPYRKGEKGLKGGRAPPHRLVRIGLGKGGAPFLPSPSPFPFFLFQLGEGREGGRGEKEGGGRRPLLVQFGSAHGGAPFGAFLSFPVWPIKAQYEFP